MWSRSPVKTYGRINGVFHAAGVLDDGPLMSKSAESAVSVLDPKVRGTLVLEEALRDVPLRCFVLFSSISSIVPTPGQIDYAAANAFLDAFALSRKGPVTVINWGPWRDVGMAARTGSPHPMLHERILDTQSKIVYSSQLSAQRQWPLSEHRLKIWGALRPLLPGTGYMEMATAAFTRGSRHGAIEFRNVFFLVPLMLGTDESRELRVYLEREQSASEQSRAFHFSVLSLETKWIEHCTGTIAHCASRPANKVDPTAIAGRCNQREIIFDEQHRTRQERQLSFGPRWQSLRRLLIGTREGLADIHLADRFSADISAFRMHPALLDLATGASFYLTEDYEHSNDLFLPISYKRMRIYHPLPAHLFSHIRSRQEEAHRGEVETSDITLFDEQGEVLAEIEGFSARRIANLQKALQEGTSTRNPTESGNNPQLEVLDRAGIKPTDGARALVRILSSNTPHAVIVVSAPLEQPGAFGHGSSLPAVSAVDHSPPLNESIEATLAAWWRELLGIVQVGLDDDFFDLGGHSLVGVRLLAKVKRTYRVDLDFAVLFDARTVRHLADVIRKLHSNSAE